MIARHCLMRMATTSSRRCFVGHALRVHQGDAVQPAAPLSEVSKVEPNPAAISTASLSDPESSAEDDKSKDPSLPAKQPLSFPDPGNEVKPFYLNKHPEHVIQQKLEEVERKLRIVEKEDLGNKRGIKSMKEILQKMNGGRRRKKRKTGTGRTRAWKDIQLLLFQRQALKHGALKLDDLRKREIAATFFGADTIVRIPLDKAKTILIEFWRRNRSELLNKYKRFHDENVSRGLDFEWQKKEVAKKQAIAAAKRAARRDERPTLIKGYEFRF